MNTSEQTLQQITRALRKAASKFTNDAENMPLTDLYLQVKQESGELLIFNDQDEELTRCVVESWLGNQAEKFYTDIQPILLSAIEQERELLDNLPILKPYSFVLIDEDKESIAELHLVDDELMLVSGNLMDGLAGDLDNFLEELMRK